MEVLIPCRCGKPVNFSYDDNMELSDEVISQIITGNFMSAVCSHCGKILKPEFPVRFKNTDKSIDILYLPENERDDYLRGKSKFIFKKPDRVVIGYPELIEKVKIITAGLDDRVIECVKYYILSKIENDNELENEVQIFFNSIKDNNLIFEIHGLKAGEIGFLPVERNFYDLNSKNIDDNIKKEPFSIFLAPPYISLFKVYRVYEEREMGNP